jgi:hypothetical protein
LVNKGLGLWKPKRMAMRVKTKEKGANMLFAKRTLHINTLFSTFVGREA